MQCDGAARGGVSTIYRLCGRFERAATAPTYTWVFRYIHVYVEGCEAGWLNVESNDVRLMQLHTVACIFAWQQ